MASAFIINRLFVTECIRHVQISSHNIMDGWMDQSLPLHYLLNGVFFVVLYYLLTFRDLALIRAICIHNLYYLYFIYYLSYV
jgi:hypothetical protein